MLLALIIAVLCGGAILGALTLQYMYEKNKSIQAEYKKQQTTQKQPHGDIVCKGSPAIYDDIREICWQAPMKCDHIAECMKAETSAIGFPMRDGPIFKDCKVFNPNQIYLNMEKTLKHEDFKLTPTDHNEWETLAKLSSSTRNSLVQEKLEHIEPKLKYEALEGIIPLFDSYSSNSKTSATKSKYYVNKSNDSSSDSSGGSCD